MASFNHFVDLVRYVSVVVPLVPVFVYFLTLKSLPFSLQPIGLLSCISALCNIAGYLFIHHMHYNAIIINIYFLLEFCILSYFYYQTYFNTKNRKVFWIAFISILLGTLIITASVQGIFVNQSYLWVLMKIALIIFSMLYRKPIISIAELHHVKSLNWINSGIMSNSLISLLPNSLTDEIYWELGRELGKFIWGFSNLGCILQFISFSIGMYYSSKIAEEASRPVLNYNIEDIPNDIKSNVLASPFNDQKSFEMKCAKLDLSKREIDVALLLVNGKTAKEIADALYISDGTVNRHKHNIYKKLGVKNVLSLAKRLSEDNG